MKKFFQIIGLLIILHSFQYSIAFADSPRKVLVEEATNTSCGPCASQNPAFQQWVKNNFDIVIPVIYHAWWPGPNDPFYLEDPAMNRGRIQYYGIDQEGVPSVRVNGKKATPSTGWYAGAAGDINALTNELNTYRNTNSPITLVVAEQRTGAQSNVSVTVQSTQALTGKKLRVAVLEYFIAYDQPPGTNGEKEFFWVARKMLPDYSGTTINISAGSEQTFNFTYTIKTTWKANNIYIVAWVQDDQTKEVLQAAQNLKVTKIQASTDNIYLTIPRNTQISPTFQITNPNSELVRVSVGLNTNGSYIPAGWQATLNTNEVILAPNETKNVTLNIKSGNKAEFAVITLKLTPKVTNPSEESYPGVYVLTEDTKYACFALANSPSAYFAYNSITSFPKYSVDCSLVPFARDILTNYNFKDMDLIVFGFSYWVRGILGGYFVESSDVFSLLNALFSNGKSTLLTSEVDLSFSVGSQGSANARDFFNNKLFIAPNGTPTLRVSVDNNGVITGTLQYPGKGGTNDPIGNGLSITFNQNYNSQTYPYRIIFTDFISILNPNYTKSILYYDNDVNKIGGVRVDNGKYRAVFLTSGFEGIYDVNTRNNFVKKIVDWLLEKTSNSGPMISLSTTALDFMEVPVQTSKTLSLDISNSGDQPLIISEIYSDPSFDPNGVFTIENLPTLPLTLNPKEKYTLNIKFTPIEEQSYFGSLVIKSNSKVNPEEIVSLDGIGVAANIPIISSSKTEVDFGNVVLQNSKVVDVDITNTGIADLVISNIELVNNNEEVFSIISAPETPATLGPYESTTITLMFTPQQAITYNALLRILSNASNNPTLTIPLAGVGEEVGSVSEVNFADGTIIKIKPIPVTDILTLSIFNPNLVESQINIKVYDLNGKMILDLGNVSARSISNELTFDLGNYLPSGRYNLQLSNGKAFSTLPLLITH
ncbi:MAG: choice-of-anchor D domain-containing protein [Candidatus Kapaibacteriales bacterium]